MPGRAPRLTNQLKGMLLEEAVLVLLEQNGYRTVADAAGDPTLGSCAAGLQVRGRGGEHQIDAVADYLVSQPFGYPQRLLVEAKCYAARRVDLETVRNALGVFRDVGEYFDPGAAGGALTRQRYHYQYAIFAAGEFTEHAQRFAFAHDIHLFPLGQSPFLRPLVAAVEASARALARVLQRQPIVEPGGARRRVRDLLRGGALAVAPDSIAAAVRSLASACAEVRGGYLAMAGGRFPLFLVPEPSLQVSEMQPHTSVRITYDEAGWYVRPVEGGRNLFSFDLPEALFERYAESGRLSRASAVQLKGDYLADLQFTVMQDGRPRLIALTLDPGWLGTIRSRPRRPE